MKEKEITKLCENYGAKKDEIAPDKRFNIMM
jgi:hypothetical protein